MTAPLSFLIKIFEIRTSHVVNFDDIASSKIEFAMVSGVLFEEISLDMKSYMSGIVSQNRFHMICHTSGYWNMGGSNK